MNLRKKSHLERLKSTLTLIGGLAAFGCLPTAQAAFIDGSISFNGNLTLDAPIPSATAITAFGPTTVSTIGQTGDYLGATGTPGVAMSPFAFSPGLSPSPVPNLWSFSVGPVTYSFELDQLVSASTVVLAPGLNQLKIAGQGTASITGLDDTPGSFSLTATGGDTHPVVTFAAFTFVTRPPQQVPDAGMATLGLLLGGAAACFGASRRSGRTARSA